MSRLELHRDRDYERRFIARHSAKVDRSGGFFACWPWMGALNGNGYGTLRGGTLHISVTGIRWIYQAHRVALAIATVREDQTIFELMDDENAVLEAAHTCHFRPCCQPDHLVWKSHRSNLADVVARYGALGRSAHDKGMRVTRCVRFTW